ncbi:MAG: helix-turn-helix domain-containing protein [Sedimentisphaerales bacterium]|nr:helix-turn-helix domain-containing protein [Sedimentisphaerales bacterium]
MHSAIESVETTQATRLFKIKEAAAYLAISERTLWTLIDNNKFPVVRFGKVRRIARDDLDAFIQSMKGC